MIPGGDGGRIPEGREGKNTGGEDAAGRYRRRGEMRGTILEGKAFDTGGPQLGVELCEFRWELGVRPGSIHTHTYIHTCIYMYIYIYIYIYIGLNEAPTLLKSDVDCVCVCFIHTHVCT